jgi:hypothetical protein
VHFQPYGRPADILLQSADALTGVFESLRGQVHLGQQAITAASGAKFQVTLAGKCTKPEPFNLTGRGPRLVAPVDPVFERRPRRPAPLRREQPTKEQLCIDEAKCV